MREDINALGSSAQDVNVKKCTQYPWCALKKCRRNYRRSAFDPRERRCVDVKGCKLKARKLQSAECNNVNKGDL